MRYARQLPDTYPHDFDLDAQVLAATIDALSDRAQPAPPAPTTTSFVALNHGELPVRARSGGELAERVRCAEDYAALGARVVVELHTESHATKSTTRAGRSPAAPTVPTAATPTVNSAASATVPAASSALADPSASGRWLAMPADPTTPTSSAARCGLAPAWSPTRQPVGA
jgi:hypothetical protein